MMVDLSMFIRKYLGVASTGDTPGNQGQCVGLIENWLDANGKPHVPGNAADLLANAPKSFYTLTLNSPANYPPVGAVVCWGPSWGGGFGHTAIVVASNVNKLVVFEQNNPTGAPPLVATHDYSGVVGWIRW